MRLRAIAAFAAALLSGTCLAQAATITIATVNNSQMVVMQKLSSVWEKKTGNTINWVVLEENVLRQRVTTDIATHGGQFDIITIGSYETPIWGKQGWLTPLDGIPGYDYNDVFSSVRSAFFGFKVGDVTISLSTIVRQLSCAPRSVRGRKIMPTPRRPWPGLCPPFSIASSTVPTAWS